MSSASSNKTKSCENLASHSGGELGEARDEILTGEQIDAILMRNDQVGFSSNHVRFSLFICIISIKPHIGLMQF